MFLLEFFAIFLALPWFVIGGSLLLLFCVTASFNGMRSRGRFWSDSMTGWVWFVAIVILVSAGVDMTFLDGAIRNELKQFNSAQVWTNIGMYMLAGLIYGSVVDVIWTAWHERTGVIAAWRKYTSLDTLPTYDSASTTPLSIQRSRFIKKFNDEYNPSSLMKLMYDEKTNVTSPVIVKSHVMKILTWCVFMWPVVLIDSLVGRLLHNVIDVIATCLRSLYDAFIRRLYGNTFKMDA